MLLDPLEPSLGRFDPFVSVNNNWDHLDLPTAVFLDPNNPGLGSAIVSGRSNVYRLNVAVTKENPLGGQWRLGVDATESRFPISVLPLNPEQRSSADISYTQPLLQGFGPRANLAPVVLARIDTERSFFQLKGAVQQQVRGVIEGYWNLVSARTSAIVRRRQVEISQLGYRRASAQFEIGLTDASGRAQARSTLAQFQAQLVAAEADVLQSEAALRNILGLPPWDEAQIVPTTEPTFERFEPDWNELVELAAQRRPDLVELKLILEADEQQLILANNNALPRLDASALYRWNGLTGEMPNGNGLASGPGFNDWTLGVNFSVPVGLRTARAQLRQRELILARDRANLDQGLHAASHNLATTVRSLAQAYEQYLAFQEARNAAQANLDQQSAVNDVGRIDGLVYRQAIADLGNSIVSEADSAANYNTLLAELELQSGTILETHGVRFYEERFGSIGPLGRPVHPRDFPQSTPPTPNADRYPPGERPAERAFSLEQIERRTPGEQRPGSPEMLPQPLPRPRER